MYLIYKGLDVARLDLPECRQFLQPLPRVPANRGNVRLKRLVAAYPWEVERDTGVSHGSQSLSRTKVLRFHSPRLLLSRQTRAYTTAFGSSY